MSFILNALRKSEQERQALQAETVSDRIFLPQPQQKSSKTTKFLAFIAIGNVLAIIGIVWFIRNNAAPTPDTSQKAIPESLLAQEKKLEPKVVTKAIPPQKSAHRAESETISIAKLIDAEEPAPLPVKPNGTKKPATDIIKQPAVVSKVELPTPTTPAIAAAIKVQAVPIEPIAIKKGIPFLSELPVEFRQTVPTFAINVFVYSEHPEERFVMIDMIKYKPGQKIKDSLLLKEILPMSLVVAFQNQTFQIARP